MKSRSITAVLVALTLGAFAACTGPEITGPTAQGTRSDLLGFDTGLDGKVANLIECPSSESATATELISPLGGVVSVGGATIAIPAGALLFPSVVTVSVPASRYVEVDISVEGVPHFIFELPVTVTISY